MISKKGNYRDEQRQIGGGNGEILLQHRFECDDMHGFFRICAEVTILPGNSIGMHPHIDDTEIFYMLEGALVSIEEDGTEAPFSVGDMMITGSGEKHSLRNDSSFPAKILAIVAIK